MKIKKTVYPPPGSTFSHLPDGFTYWQRYISAMNKILKNDNKKIEAPKRHFFDSFLNN